MRSPGCLDRPTGPAPRSGARGICHSRRVSTGRREGVAAGSPARHGDARGCDAGASPGGRRRRAALGRPRRIGAAVGGRQRLPLGTAGPAAADGVRGSGGREGPRRAGTGGDGLAGVGAALSHVTALVVWRLRQPGCDEPVHVTVPTGVRVRSRGWLAVHHVRRRPAAVVRRLRSCRSSRPWSSRGRAATGRPARAGHRRGGRASDDSGTTDGGRRGRDAAGRSGRAAAPDRPAGGRLPERVGDLGPRPRVHWAWHAAVPTASTPGATRRRAHDLSRRVRQA